MRLLLIIGLIAGAATWWFWGRTLEAGKVVHAQLEAIGKHDYSLAYTFLSDNAKSKYTPEQFQELVQRNVIVDNNYTSDFMDRKLEKNVARFSGTVRALGGQRTSATFTLVKQGDRWFVDDFQF
jgi:hypothetical protein